MDGGACQWGKLAEGMEIMVVGVWGGIWWQSRTPNPIKASGVD